MKFGLVGKNAAILKPLLEARGIELADSFDAADLLISYGGDGTLIGAEREFPEVPKLGMRDASAVTKCPEHEDALVLDRFLSGELAKTELMKITATIDGKRLRGMNDIILRNSDVRSSVRFRVAVNNKMVSDETIGDGLVAATPFGSSAYFRSITNTVIRTGMGLAFNNCTEFLHHLVLKPDDVVQVEIVRGPAQLTADNSPEIIDLSNGDAFVIQRSTRSAVVYGIDSLRCGQCRYSHAPRRRF
ncbi:MAG: hypothetical protein V3W41_17130 [Planctomycetota bacterium]